MARVLGFSTCSSGLSLCAPDHYKFLFGVKSRNRIRFKDYNDNQVSKGKIQYYATRHGSNMHVLKAGRDNYRLSHDDDYYQREPFWLSLCKEAIWSLKTLLVFLVEQPSQLRHIEWPSFRSTLRTAFLTLVLVAVLIVALSSVDSLLCYLLALFLRRTP